MSAGLSWDSMFGKPSGTTDGDLSLLIQPTENLVIQSMGKTWCRLVSYSFWFQKDVLIIIHLSSEENRSCNK